MKIKPVPSKCSFPAIRQQVQLVVACMFASLAPLCLVAGSETLPWTSLEKAHPDQVTDFTYSRDGKWLLSAGGKVITLWDVATGREVREFTGHNEDVQAIAISPDAKWLASGARDNSVKIWDVESGSEVRTLAGHSGPVDSVAFSPDGHWLASGSRDKTAKIWDVATGNLLHTLTGHTDSITAVAFHPNGQFLATASWDETVKIWGTGSWREQQTLKGHKDVVSKRMTGADSFSITIVVAGIYDMAFSPDGRLLATASNDKKIKLWDVAKWRERRTLTGHTGGIKALAFSPDGRWLVTSSGSESLKVWDSQTGRFLQDLGAAEEDIETLAFSPDGRWLTTCGGTTIGRTEVDWTK